MIKGRDAGNHVSIILSALRGISSVGGYDPRKQWWWNIAIAPYPIGWLMNIALSITRASREKNRPATV